MEKIAVIVNPYSGRNKLHDAAPQLNKIMRGVGYAAKLEKKNDGRNGALNIDDVVEEACENDVEVLAVSGGDGTMHSVVTKAILLCQEKGGKIPCFATLRGGTANSVADDLGIRGQPEQILEKIVSNYRHNTLAFEPRTTLRINDGCGREEYGFIFASSAVANAYTKYYYGDSNIIEKLLKLFNAAANPDRLQDSLLGERWTLNHAHSAKEYTVMIAATIRTVGFGFSPFKRAYDGSKKFHLIAANANLRDVIGTIPRMRAGLPLTNRWIDEFVLEEAALAPSKPARYVVDGEIKMERKKVHLTTGPGVLFAKV